MDLKWPLLETLQKEIESKFILAKERMSQFFCVVCTVLYCTVLYCTVLYCTVL